MDLIQKTALSLVSLTRDERKAIPAGDYSVDALVRIRSTFGKGTNGKVETYCIKNLKYKVIKYSAYFISFFFLNCL